MAQELSEADLVRFSSGIFSKEPMFELCVNEARFGLARVLPTLLSFNPQTVEVLEVGAGPCILAAYLASKGLRVTAVEPLGQEFDFLADLQGRVLEFCRGNWIELKLVRTEGEQLDLPSRFDLAFTINSLEHMREPLLTIDNMYNSLKPGGIALVHCPNYTIPFDTHFNIFLITRSRPINKWLYRSKISRYPKVWDELNFVRYIDVRRTSRKWSVCRAGFESMTTIERDEIEWPAEAVETDALRRAFGAAIAAFESRYTKNLHSAASARPAARAPRSAKQPPHRRAAR